MELQCHHSFIRRCQLRVVANIAETVTMVSSNYWTLIEMSIYGFRAHQHQKSLAPIMNDFLWLWWPMISRNGLGLIFPTFANSWGKTSTRKTDPTGDQTRATRWEETMLPPQPQQWSWTFIVSIVMYCWSADDIVTLSPEPHLQWTASHLPFYCLSRQNTVFTWI